MFTCQERVYYEDTDAGGIVYHANYLKYMERCRCLWLEHLGFNIQTLQQQGVLFVVRSANLEFEQPAKLFDELIVSLEVLQVGKVRLSVLQKIYNKEQLLCKAQIKLATLEGSSYKLAPMPLDLQTAIKHGA